MKHLLAALLIVALTAGAATAVPISNPRNGHQGPTTYGVSYNPSSGQQSIIVKQGLHGTYYGQKQADTDFSIALSDGHLCFRQMARTCQFYVTYAWGVKIDSGETCGEWTVVNEVCF